MNKEIAKAEAQEFGLEKNKAEEIQLAFSPMIEAKKACEKEYNKITAMVIDEESCELAGTLRKKLVKVRTGIAKVHKSQKNYFLQAGKYVDSWKNKETLPIEQMEEKLKSIEKHFENIEKERIANLTAERTEELTALGVEFIPAGLAQMDDKQWESTLWMYKVAKKERDEAAKKEAEEQARKEQEEKERLEKIEKENAKLKKEAERLKAIEKEKEEKLAEERKEREEKEKAQREKEAEERRKIKEKADKELAEANAKLEEERKKREEKEAEELAKKQEKARKEAEERKRSEDIEHRKEINNSILADLQKTGITTEQAKSIIKLIAGGKISNVSIKY